MSKRSGWSVEIGAARRRTGRGKKKLYNSLYLRLCWSGHWDCSQTFQVYQYTAWSNINIYMYLVVLYEYKNIYKRSFWVSFTCRYDGFRSLHSHHSTQPANCIDRECEESARARVPQRSKRNEGELVSQWNSTFFFISSLFNQHIYALEIHIKWIDDRQFLFKKIITFSSFVLFSAALLRVHKRARRAHYSISISVALAHTPAIPKPTKQQKYAQWIY